MKNVKAGFNVLDLEYSEQDALRILFTINMGLTIGGFYSRFNIVRFRVDEFVDMGILDIHHGVNVYGNDTDYYRLTDFGKKEIVGDLFVLLNIVKDETTWLNDHPLDGFIFLKARSMCPEVIDEYTEANLKESSHSEAQKRLKKCWTSI